MTTITVTLSISRVLIYLIPCLLAVDEPTGDFYLFTKDRENSLSEVYRYPYPQSIDKNPFTLGNLNSVSVFPQSMTP